MSKIIEDAAVVTGRNGILVPDFEALRTNIDAYAPIMFRKFFDRLFKLNDVIIAPNDDYRAGPNNRSRLVLPPTEDNPLTLLTYYPLSTYERPGRYTILTPPDKAGDFVTQMKLAFDRPTHRPTLDIELEVRDADEITRRDWSYYAPRGIESCKREFHFSQSDVQFLGAAAVRLESLLSE